MAQILKFRPTFSIDELLAIKESLESEIKSGNSSPFFRTALLTVTSTLLKAELGKISPSHIETVRPSRTEGILNSLGGLTQKAQEDFLPQPTYSSETIEDCAKAYRNFYAMYKPFLDLGKTPEEIGLPAKMMEAIETLETYCEMNNLSISTFLEEPPTSDRSSA